MGRDEPAACDGDEHSGVCLEEYLVDADTDGLCAFSLLPCAATSGGDSEGSSFTALVALSETGWRTELHFLAPEFEDAAPVEDVLISDTPLLPSFSLSSLQPRVAISPVSLNLTSGGWLVEATIFLEETGILKWQ